MPNCSFATACLKTMGRNLCALKYIYIYIYIMKRKFIFHSTLVAPLPFLLVAAGPLPAQTAMKWSAVLSAKPSRFWAGGTAGLFVSLASFDYQRLSAEYLWHHAHSWKRLSEWDDSGRNVTQKYLGTHHILPASGWESSDLQWREEKHNCVFSVYPERGWEGPLECRGYQICERRMRQLSWNENMAINQVGVRGILTHQWHNPVIENIPNLHECALTTGIHTHFFSFSHFKKRVSTTAFEDTVFPKILDYSVQVGCESLSRGKGLCAWGDLWDCKCKFNRWTGVVQPVTSYWFTSWSLFQPLMGVLWRA